MQVTVLAETGDIPTVTPLGLLLLIVILVAIGVIVYRRRFAQT